MRNNSYTYPTNILFRIFGNIDEITDDMLVNFEPRMQKISQWLYNHGEKLTPVEKDIINVRYKGDNPLQKVASIYGMSRERIRVLEKNLINKLRFIKFQNILKGLSEDDIDPSKVSVEELLLSKRIINSLKNNGINTLEKLKATSDAELENISYLSKAGIRDIHKSLGFLNV